MIARRMENFKNTPDRLKYELIKELAKLPESEKVSDFLLNVVENERYDRIKIHAVLSLKKYTSTLVEERLKTIFSFEHDKSVKLVIVENLGERDSADVDDFFKKVAVRDQNDVVRATAIRKLHEREKVDDSEMLDLIMEVIQTDTSVFPRQIALSILPCYADSSIYRTIRNVFIREEMHQMKKLLFHTLKEISVKLELELDVNEPLDPISIVDDSKKSRKHRRQNRKERKKKKMGKDDYLYF